MKLLKTLGVFLGVILVFGTGLLVGVVALYQTKKVTSPSVIQHTSSAQIPSPDPTSSYQSVTPTQTRAVEESVISIAPKLSPQSTPTPVTTIKKRSTTISPQKTIQPVTQSIPTAWTCDCSKTCSNMSSCSEAQYQLNVCGCSVRDNDKDGIACDSDCQ